MGRRKYKLYDRVMFETHTPTGEIVEIECEILTTDGDYIYKLRAINVEDWMFKVGFYEEDGYAVFYGAEICLN